MLLLQLIWHNQVEKLLLQFYFTIIIILGIDSVISSKAFWNSERPILCQKPEEEKNDATIKMRSQEPVEALLLHMIQQRCFKVEEWMSSAHNAEFTLNNWNCSNCPISIVNPSNTPDYLKEQKIFNHHTEECLIFSLLTSYLNKIQHEH